jgi:hypothetical protein
MYASVDDVALERVDDLDGVDEGWTFVDDMVIAKFAHDGESVLRLGDEPPSGEESGDATGTAGTTDTAGTMTSASAGSMTAGTAADTETDTAGGSGGSDGCGCRSQRDLPPPALLLLLVAASRRRSGSRPTSS